jgi:hypothetical protein
MKGTTFSTALLLASLAFPGGTAALAVDGVAEQELDVEVIPEDILGIEVADVAVDAVLRGATTEQTFRMQVFNTTSAGWRVTVEGEALTATGEGCPELGEGYSDWCWGADGLPGTIPASNLFLRGGSIPGTVASSEGPLDLQPLVLMEGTAMPQQYWIDFEENPPLVRLTVPEGTPYGRYHTTLTYTITGTGNTLP